MKLLATKKSYNATLITTLPPPQTIRVGYMKHYFFCAFLSLLLASCGGGGGGSDSGASSKKKAKLCKPLIANGKGEIPWDKKTKKHSTTCTVISCDAGYDNDVDSTKCQQTASGFYSLAKDKTRKTCPTTIPTHSLVDTTTGLKLETDCWKCESGSLKNTKQKKCTLPAKGKYYDVQGTLQNCNLVGSTPSGGFKEFLDNTGAVPKATDCNFSCKSGYEKIVSTYSCNKAQACVITNGGGLNLWDIRADDFSTTCTMETCNTGFVKNMGGNSCDIPDLGKYADNVGREQDCNDPTGDSGGFNIFLPNSGAVSSATGCGFSCNAGFVKDSSARECNYPSSGNYVTARNTESPCNSITTEGTAVATRIVGAASTATTCPFSCTAGYVVDTSTPKCKYPTQGTYADAQGAEVGCTDITSMTGFGSWLEGAADSATACPFSCASGYTISGRMCNKAIPQTLALGQDSSHVLFDNGEVEAWGKVSASPWRSHIKEDLGSYTPQVLVSGYNHQCIILKNAALNHGSLMCWGKNGNDQLGVGDNNPRSTPTAVTVAFLGDAGGGVPNTVKSVSGGKGHTCALLNNDTVKCWGRNHKGQIGGGSGGTISGSAGDPLSGGIASRIAIGGFHTCAVLSDNSVQCWGLNNLGQTGGGTPSLGAGKTATEITTGGAASCAILNDASVVCWGYLGFPVLGVGKTATKITLGAQHGCVLLSDKTVKCWGLNINGQTGGGSAGSNRVLRGTSGDPLGGQTAIQIAAGDNHACAIMESDHSVKCWGKNIDDNSNGFYGQIVGKVAMTGGSDGTGTSTGESQTLTANSTPTAIALEEDAGGKICKITLIDGGNTWILKDYTTTPLTYNTGGSTNISTAIDNMIAEIGPTVNVVGTTNVTLSKSGSDKIAATTDNAVLNGMSFIIYHDDNSADCTGVPPSTPITLGGASGGAIATGLWVISNGFSGSGDKTVNLDSVHLNLGNSLLNIALSKESIADKIVADVNGASWAGKQKVNLPYTATKLDGSSDANDDCPDADVCVLFSRVFKGTEGNYGIPFGDRDYEH